MPVARFPHETFTVTPLTPTPDSGDSSDEGSGGHFAGSMGLLAGVLGCICLGALYFLCRRRLPGCPGNSHRRGGAPSLPEVYCIPLDGRYLSRGHAQPPAAPPPGEVNPAYIGERELPPPYSSLDFPPAYDAAVTKEKAGRDGEEGLDISGEYPGDVGVAVHQSSSQSPTNRRVAGSPSSDNSPT